MLVSHDRDFIDRVCDRLLVPEGDGRWTAYSGGWSDMLAQRGRSPFAAAREERSAPSPAREERQKTKPKSSTKMSFKDSHALETLPKEIEVLEAGIAKVNAALADPDLFQRDPKRFRQLMRLLDRSQLELAEKEEAWLVLELKREDLEGA